LKIHWKSIENFTGFWALFGSLLAPLWLPFLLFGSLFGGLVGVPKLVAKKTVSPGNASPSMTQKWTPKSIFLLKHCFFFSKLFPHHFWDGVFMFFGSRTGANKLHDLFRCLRVSF
jgi:hypothetical protein